MSRDASGRPYATVADTKAGTVLVADAGFVSYIGYCIQPGAVLTVKDDGDGLYVPCTHGRHYLDGQIENDGDVAFLMGFYPKT